MAAMAALTVLPCVMLQCMAPPCMAQDRPQSADNPDSQTEQTQTEQPQTRAAIKAAPVTIPAGTVIALVLSHPIQSRYLRHGDDIYAQVTDPVDVGNAVAIPPGTFVQGTVDKLERHGGRAELRLQAMSITFPDGYVAPLAGPVTLESGDGYAIKDPGPGRTSAAFAAPLAGAGIGALIGHAVNSPPTTITSTLPPGCTGPPPNCLTSSVTGPGNAGRNTVIGAGIGGAIGAAASLTLLLGSHHFFIDAGAPVEVTLRQPVTLQGAEVAAAVEQSAQHPMPPMPVAPRPQLPLPPDTTPPFPTSPPPTPGTPPIIIPGPPGPGGTPGAPIIIPGTPPGTP